MFKFLFGSKDATSNWSPYSGDSLTFDLDTGSLNDVKLGQHLDSLSFLGPCENRGAADQSAFDYYSLGLEIGCHADSNEIHTFSIVRNVPWEKKHQPFTGRVLANGRSIDLSTLTLSRFTEQFGDPYWLDRDEKESLLFYEFPGREWQVEFALAESFNCLWVTTVISMADESGRKDYGVTKEWPPEFSV